MREIIEMLNSRRNFDLVLYIARVWTFVASEKSVTLADSNIRRGMVWRYWSPLGDWRKSMGMMQEKHWHIHLDILMIFFLPFLPIAQGCLFFFSFPLWLFLLDGMWILMLPINVIGFSKLIHYLLCFSDRIPRQGIASEWWDTHIKGTTESGRWAPPATNLMLAQINMPIEWRVTCSTEKEELWVCDHFRKNAASSLKRYCL